MMDSSKELKQISFMLTGLFARLQLNKITVAEANVELVGVTDSLDKLSESFENKVKQLTLDGKHARLQNQQLHKEAYALREKIKRLEAKVVSGKQKLTKMKDEIARLQMFQENEDSFLMESQESQGDSQQQHEATPEQSQQASDTSTAQSTDLQGQSQQSQQASETSTVQSTDLQGQSQQNQQASETSSVQSTDLQGQSQHSDANSEEHEESQSDKN